MTDNPPTDKENCYRWEYRTVMVIIVAVVIECMKNTQLQMLTVFISLSYYLAGNAPTWAIKNIAADIAN